MNDIRRQTVSVVAVQSDSRIALRQPAVETVAAKVSDSRTARTLFCHVLDRCSLAALAVAAGALLTVMLAQGAADEAVLFGIFQRALMLAVAGFLVARSCQIAVLLWNEPKVTARDLPARLPSEKIEVLVDRERIGRAA